MHATAGRAEHLRLLFHTSHALANPDAYPALNPVCVLAAHYAGTAVLLAVPVQKSVII